MLNTFAWIISRTEANASSLILARWVVVQDGRCELYGCHIGERQGGEALLLMSVLCVKGDRGRSHTRSGALWLTLSLVS